jgi:hypothetical protein
LVSQISQVRLAVTEVFMALESSGFRGRKREAIPLKVSPVATEFTAAIVQLQKPVSKAISILKRTGLIILIMATIPQSPWSLDKRMGFSDLHPRLWNI